MKCPACPSEAYVDGVCATCGYRGGPYSPARVRLAKRKRERREKQRMCPHREWAFVAFRWNGNEKQVAHRCRDCGLERQTAA